MATIDLFSDGDPVVEFQSSVLIDKDAEFVPMKVMGVEFTLRQQIKNLDKNETDEAAEQRGASAIGTGHLVWDGGIAASRILEHADKLADKDLARATWEDKAVLELGSGVGGLGGMAASLIGATRVVVSDVKDLVGMLQQNVDSFVKQATAGHRKICDIRAAELEWGNEEHMAAVTSGGKFDICICCDVLNTEPAVRQIGATLDRVLKKGGMVVFFQSVWFPVVQKELVAFLKELGVTWREIDSKTLTAIGVMEVNVKLLQWTRSGI